jgi:NodT family efflux transporter outer membrane factor (OMF) lipoprotein
VRAVSESADLSSQASEGDYHATLLSLSGQLAETWINLLAQRRKQQQLEEQLQIHQKLLELMEMRFMMAKASALDVYQQGQTVSGIEGVMITVKSQIQLSLHQLALLTGKAATTELNLQQSSFPEISAIPATGLPADLLAQRPDIRAAGLRLQSANWSVAAARADRLPKLQLDASLHYSAGILDALLDTWILRLAGSLSGPIFDGGKKKAEVERSKAVVDERLAEYRRVVLTAIKEVEDALRREDEFRQTIKNIDQRIMLTDNAYREATWRYLNGLSDFLPVLREQINQVTLQLDRIQAGADLLKARIELHKALGGSWFNSLAPPKQETL